MSEYSSQTTVETIEVGSPPSSPGRADMLPESTRIIAKGLLHNDDLIILTQTELGRGNNGIVYKATSKYFNRELVVKSTKLKIKKERTNKKDINFYCTSIINSVEIDAIFPKCSNLIICTYGIIANRKNIDLISEPTKRILLDNNLIFISDEISDDQIFLLYEFIKGETLRDRIYSEREINFEKYGYQILQTLVLLQKYGLVHLDIKPDNFMIDYNDNIKFIDVEFLCKQSNIDCIMRGMSKSYTSPEAYDSMLSPNKYMSDKSYLSKSDVFSTGLVLYEMISRKVGMKSILLFAVKMEGPELELEFPEDKIKWKQLIDQMVKRKYLERINANDALTEFLKITDLSQLPPPSGNGGKNIRNKRNKNKSNNRRSNKIKRNKRQTNKNKNIRKRI